MKFFFCESCGQRIEQAELDAGRARDKQAKGVFCQACAQAVMTQTFEALQEEQARKLLGGDEARPRPRSALPKSPRRFWSRRPNRAARAPPPSCAPLRRSARERIPKRRRAAPRTRRLRRCSPRGPRCWCWPRGSF
ncbi:MAG: hypothetical protein M5U26_09490 [Planctomycetota bacterium]|nr:hypothetical protein [Planctomycetota bacterium]